ncbi:MAG: hypothetical protein AB8B78_06070 [Polaribacter sp.]
MKKLKISIFIFVMILLQNCKAKYPIIPVSTTFGKVSSYAGTCESAQGFCSEVTDTFSNGTIQRVKKRFDMKLNKESISEDFINKIIKTKTFTVENDFYISEELTNRLIEKEKNKEYKIKIKKGDYPVKIEGRDENLKIIIYFKPPADVYVNGKYMGKYDFVIIIN